MSHVLAGRLIAMLFLSTVGSAVGFAQVEYEPAAPIPISPFGNLQRQVDLGGDSFPDFLYAHTGPGIVSVVEGDGTGMSLTEIVTVGYQPSALAAGDRDGNGVAELFVARFDPPLVQVFDRTSGVFEPVDVIDLPGQPTAMEARDLDLDGLLDLAIAVRASGTGAAGSVLVIYGSAPGTILEYPVYARPADLHAVDVTGDGFLDLVVACAGVAIDDGGVVLLESDGGTTFVTNPILEDVAAVQLRSGDFDLDGDQDLLLGRWTYELCGSAADILWNQGTGFVATSVDFPCGPGTATTTDANRDGIPDLLLTDLPTLIAGATGLFVMLGGGDGTFGEPELVASSGYGTAVPASVDIDGDGAEDLLMPGYSADLYLYYNRSDAEFFQRGDANGDGAVDIGDAVLLLASLFVPGADPLGCTKAGDANDDGGVDVSDAVATLAFLFVPGTPPLPDPGTSCGVDPTADTLDCTVSSCP